jgi:hypothetical protein
MVISNGYEEQTRRLLSETRSELSKVDAEITELSKKKAELEAEAQGFEAALSGYLRRIGKQDFSTENWRKLLSGRKMTHPKRLIAIAKHKGGLLKVSEATDILYGNRFIKSKRRSNAYRIVYSLLANLVGEGIFQKTDSGEYKLVGVQQSLIC